MSRESSGSLLSALAADDAGRFVDLLIEALEPHHVAALRDRLDVRSASSGSALLTVAEAAERSGLSPKTISRAIKSGALVASYVCSRPRIESAEYDRWIESRRTMPRTPRSARPSHRAPSRTFRDRLENDRAVP